MMTGVLAAIVVIVLLPFLFGRLLLGWFGKWLVIADPLQPATAIVVLGGYLPYRAMEAAEMYRQGWAPEVWLTKYARNADEAILAKLGIEVTPEYVFSRQVLQKLGVPETAILEIEPGCVDTGDELRTAVRQAQARGKQGPIILITSKCHARRVKVIWKSLNGARYPAIVRYSKQDPFSPDRWFLNTRDARTVTYEFFGLLNAWCGFPIRAHRP
jgi:uncharacterized SAM-binding protein YcdF (DUF218 family)